MEDFNKKKNDLEEQKADVGASFDGVEVGRLEQALADLEKSKASFEDKAEHAGEATENQVKQVEGLGGSQGILDEKTAPVDEKIEEVKGKVEGEVEGIKEKVNEDTAENPLQKLEVWSKDLEDRITRLTGNIEMGNKEATDYRSKMKAATNPGDEKLYRESMIYWDSWTTAKQRELKEVGDQFQKNKNYAETFDKRKDLALNGLKNAKKELADLLEKGTSDAENHKNLIRKLSKGGYYPGLSHQDDMKISVSKSELDRTRYGIDELKQKVQSLESELERHFPN